VVDRPGWVSSAVAGLRALVPDDVGGRLERHDDRERSAADARRAPEHADIRPRRADRAAHVEVRAPDRGLVGGLGDLDAHAWRLLARLTLAAVSAGREGAQARARGGNQEGGSQQDARFSGARQPSYPPQPALDRMNK